MLLASSDISGRAENGGVFHDRAAYIVVAGQGAATGFISAKVAALTEGVLKAMLVSRLKVVTAVLLVVAASFGATGVICRTPAGVLPKAQEPAEQDKKADADKGKKAKSDEEQFQGVWNLIEAFGDGKKEKVEDQKVEAVLIVKQGTLHIQASEDGKTIIDEFFVYKLDSAPAVKMIDLADWKKGFEEKDQIIEGVYNIGGDTFSLCFGEAALSRGRTEKPNRPASLETKEGSSTYTWTFKREKKNK